MPDILCPTCGAALTLGSRQWLCPKGHCFDVARQGYVNLLPVTQKHSLHPGDTREQVAARRTFLEAGFYEPLAQAVCQAARRYGKNAKAILDAGCGEGYYSAQIARALPGQLYTVWTSPRTPCVWLPGGTSPEPGFAERRLICPFPLEAWI